MSLEALAAALAAEKWAEVAKRRAEDIWRAAWWETTWQLAKTTDARWPEARAMFVKDTGQAASTAGMRRRCGQLLTRQATGGVLLVPTLATEATAVSWTGGDGRTLAQLLVLAETDGLSKRELRAQLTGQPNVPDLTTAQRAEVVRREATRNPEAVVRQVVADRPDVVADVAVAEAPRHVQRALAQLVGVDVNPDSPFRSMDAALDAIEWGRRLRMLLASARDWLDRASPEQRVALAEALAPQRDAVAQLIEYAEGVTDADLAAAVQQWGADR